MTTRSQKIRLGIFVVVALTAMLITIGIIVAPKLFEVRDIYYIGYENISLMGLQEGGPVKYHGLTVGTVSNISIDPVDISRVIVEVSLEHGTPIKQDTRADIELLGITGIKVIELRSGSPESAYLKPRDFIMPGKSITEMITGQAEVMLEKLEIILNNLAIFSSVENREKIMRLVENSGSTLGEISGLLEENHDVISKSIQNFESVSYELQELAINSNITMAKLAQLAGSDTTERVIANLADITDALKEAELTELIHEMNQTLYHTGQVLKEIDATIAKNRSDFGYSIQAVKESVEYLNQFSRMITEDPSILVRGTEPKNAPDFNLEK
ncbi:MCE family protein [candidate division KSB1 bacterium]|nr:MCE family protein [candidate division KSB1 bacterium]